MTIAWRKVAFAGVAGFCGGQAIAKLRRHPDVVLPILQASAASGVVGGLVGWGVSLYRGVPPHAHSLSLAANFAIASAAFLIIRRLVHSALIEGGSWSSNQSPLTVRSPTATNYISSSVSGGATGALSSLISRLGLRSVLLTSLGGMGVGLCAQVGYDKLQKWRKKKAIQIYCEDMSGEKSSPFENWTLENFEARFLGFWHQRAESITVEIEMLSLEAVVAEERKKLAKIDQVLAERGVSQEEMERLLTEGDSREIETLHSSDCSGNGSGASELGAAL